MQAYQHIISHLTEEQKIRMLCDFGCLYSSEMAGLGVPRIRCTKIGEVEHGGLPAEGALARSWSAPLIREVSALLCSRAAGDGTRLAVLPSAKGALGARYTSLSEDPYLSSVMSGAYLDGALDVDMNACLDAYSYLPHKNGKHPHFTKHAPSEQAVLEQVCIPFYDTISAHRCAGVFVGSKTKLDLLGQKKQTLRHSVSKYDTVKAIADGDICMEASSEALQRAANAYRHISSAIEHGRATSEDLAAAVDAGEAISEQTLDEALDRLLCFVAECGTTVKKKEDDGTLVRRAVCESTVLLENKDSLLPLKASQKICVIGASDGDLKPLSAALGEQGHEVASFVKGYREGERDDTLTEEALDAAAVTDTALLFFGADTLTEKISAPVISLLDKLGRADTSAKIIAVVSSDITPDLGFIRSLGRSPDAILLTPRGADITAIAEMLCGKSAPSGRLTATLAEENDGYRDGLFEGPFVGYRYYDTVGAGALYPFGHGLSFTEFKYSALSVDSEKIRFTVENIGKCDGVCVPQVYLGVKRSASLCPKKQLVGFARLEIAAGGKIDLEIPLADIRIYSRESKSFAARSGEYTVFVGSSVSDIALTKTVSHGEKTAERECEDISDYLPTYTNIFKEHYLLEAEQTPMKSSLRNLIFGICAVVLAVCVKIFDIVSRTNSIFLTAVSAILAIAAVVFFILEMSDRKKQLKLAQEQVDAANDKLFEDADKISVPSAEELFDSTVKTAESDDHALSGEAGEYDHFTDVDKDLTFAIASAELAEFARTRGILLGDGVAAQIFASLAASRLVITNGLAYKQLSSLVSVLGEYFGCPSGIDIVDGAYESESDVVYNHTSDTTESAAKSALAAIQSARTNPRNLHLAVLDRVTLADISKYFTPFARYARSPHAVNSVNIKDEDGRSISFVIPENLWFIVNLKDGESYAALPEYITETSTVNNWRFELGSPTGDTVHHRAFRYGQMEYLCDKARTGANLDEDAWKRIDKLEAFSRRYSDFHIGNKMWLGLEVYISVLLDTGIDAVTTLDNAIAVKLLPALICALSGKISREERGLGETLDAIFGDDATSVCRRTIKNSGANII